MANRVDNVLFLYTANSARGVMAEAILDRLGGGRFRAFGAGARPAGDVHPETRALLRSLGYRTEGLWSKGWEEFSGGDRGPDAERRAVFAGVYNEIESSVKLPVKLPFGGLGPAGLKREIDAIGRR